MTLSGRVSTAALLASVCALLFVGCDRRETDAGGRVSLGGASSTAVPPATGTPADSAGAATARMGTASESAAAAATSAPSSTGAPSAAAAGTRGAAPTASAPVGAAASRHKAAAPELAPRKDANGVTDVTFDQLKFDIDKGQKFEWKMLTPGVEALKGAKIRIRGFILPDSALQTTGLKEFVFVRDNGECCFGPGAALYDCMRVEMAADQAANFSLRPLTLEGTLVFDPLEFDGHTLALFLIRDASVR